MSDRSADFLDRLDAAIGCQQCGGPLGESPSDDFCGDRCQTRWHTEHSDRLTSYRDPWHDFGAARLPGVGTDAMNTASPDLSAAEAALFAFPQRFMLGLSHDETERRRTEVVWRDPATPTRADLTEIRGWVATRIGEAQWQPPGTIDRDTELTFARDDDLYDRGGNLMPAQTTVSFYVRHSPEDWAAMRRLFAGMESTAVIVDETHRMPRRVRHPGMRTRTPWVGGRGRRGRGGPRR